MGMFEMSPFFPLSRKKHDWKNLINNKQRGAYVSEIHGIMTASQHFPHGRHVDSRRFPDLIQDVGESFDALDVLVVDFDLIVHHRDATLHFYYPPVISRQNMKYSQVRDIRIPENECIPSINQPINNRSTENSTHKPVTIQSVRHLLESGVQMSA